MNKENIAFGVTLVLTVLLVTMCGPAKRKLSRGKSGGGEREARSLESLDPTWQAQEDSAWSRAGVNSYRAPRPFESLPPIDIPAPPLQRLPHPGPPLPFDLGPKLGVTLQRVITPDPELSLAGADGLGTTLQVNETVEGEGANEGEESSLDEVLVPRGAQSEADRVRLNVQEQLEAERRRQREAQNARERRAGMDRIVWKARNETRYGQLMNASESEDRFAVKLRFDELSASNARSSDLSKLRLRWREDRGAERGLAPAILVRADKLSEIDFAETPVNTYRLAMLTTPKDDGAAQLKLARDLVVADEDQLAERHLRSMIQAGLTPRGTFRLLGEVLGSRFAYREQLTVLREGLERNPQDAELHALSGHVLRRLRLPEAARSAFEQALALEEQTSLALLGLGLCDLDVGRISSAAERLSQVRDRSRLPGDLVVEGDLGLARIKLQQDQLDGVESSLRLALTNAPKNRGAHAALATATLLSKGAAAALPIIEAGREALPLDGRLVYLEGVVKAELGQYGEANSLFRLARGLDATLTAESHLAEAMLVEMKGDLAGALALVEAAGAANPALIDVQYAKGRLLALLGDASGAAETMVPVLGARAGDPLVCLVMARSSLGSQELSAASRFLERAAVLKGDPSAYLARRLTTAVRAADRRLAGRLADGLSESEKSDPWLQAGIAYREYALLRQAVDALANLRSLREREGVPEPLKQWAAAQFAAIEENRSLQVWRDAFDRTGTKLLRDWERDVGQGLAIRLADGALEFSGQQGRDKGGRATAVYQERPNRRLQSWAVTLEMAPQEGVYQGVGLLAFRKLSSAPPPYDGQQEREKGRLRIFRGFQIALDPDGRLVHRICNQGRMSEWEALDVPWGSGRDSVRISIERMGERSDDYRVVFDRAGQRLGTAELEVQGLSSFGKAVELQVFVQAAAGTQVKGPRADDFEIVTRK